ncbi:uncharacterized protein J3D65DRAFT_697468 [Phyllosticta citribraziliensis]|uniref:Uncharacterized protein n=1 Tax=Phyllosticta citribraziliensis TaxID=989973 RepID=A0ABR1LKR0_9PEZI
MPLVDKGDIQEDNGKPWASKEMRPTGNMSMSKEQSSTAPAALQDVQFAAAAVCKEHSYTAVGALWKQSFVAAAVSKDHSCTAWFRPVDPDKQLRSQFGLVFGVQFPRDTSIGSSAGQSKPFTDLDQQGSNVQSSSFRTLFGPAVSPSYRSAKRLPRHKRLVTEESADTESPIDLTALPSSPMSPISPSPCQSLCQPPHIELDGRSTSPGGPRDNDNMSLGDFERKSDGENNWDAASTRDLAGYEHPSDDESTTRDKPSDSEDDLFVRTRRSKSIAPPGELKRPLPLSDWEIQAADESAAIARSAKRPKMDPQPESGSTKVWRKNPAHPYAAESQEILAWTSTEHPNGKRDWSIIDGPNSLIPRRIMKAKEPTRKTCRDKQIQQFDETEFMIELQANAMLHLKIFFPDLKAWDILEGESNFRGQSGPVRRHPPGPFITPLFVHGGRSGR